MRPDLLLPVLLGLCAVPAFADVKTATARAKAGDYDAASVVRCAQEVGEALDPCEASVARDAASTVLVVTFPNGFKRMLMFEEGSFLRGDTTMSGVGTDTDWMLEDDVYHIRVDDQRFLIPVPLVTGE